MIRMQVRLTERQAEVLRRLAKHNSISRAEVVRRLIDRCPETEALPDCEEAKRRALAVAGTCHADVTDMSTRHDDYFVEAILADHNSSQRPTLTGQEEDRQ